MRAILQRVSSASVEVGGRTVGAIGVGLLVLVGVEKDDDEVAAQRMVEKLAGLRIWSDATGKMNLDAAAADAAFLLVSQFTLAADLSRGRRPSFDSAAAPAIARPLVESVAAGLERRGFSVATGVFGASMQVSLVNDGPVTFVLDVTGGSATRRS